MHNSTWVGKTFVNTHVRSNSVFILCDTHMVYKIFGEPEADLLDSAMQSTMVSKKKFGGFDRLPQ